MNRFDIAEAHAVLEWDYNKNGWLQERPSNCRRRQATSVQLHRMGFRARPDLSIDSLEDDGKEVYLTNVLRWGLPRDAEQNKRVKAFFSESWLQDNYPSVHSELYPGASLE